MYGLWRYKISGISQNSNFLVPKKKLLHRHAYRQHWQRPSVWSVGKNVQWVFRLKTLRKLFLVCFFFYLSLKRSFWTAFSFFFVLILFISAEEEFDELCFEFGIELDDVVSLIRPISHNSVVFVFKVYENALLSLSILCVSLMVNFFTLDDRASHY